jgi:hypothetical protein
MDISAQASSLTDRPRAGQMGLNAPGDVMKPADRFWDDFLFNLIAWFFLLLLIITVYQNHELTTKRRLLGHCDAAWFSTELRS